MAKREFIEYLREDMSRQVKDTAPFLSRVISINRVNYLASILVPTSNVVVDNVFVLTDIYNIAPNDTVVVTQVSGRYVILGVIAAGRMAPNSVSLPGLVLEEGRKPTNIISVYDSDEEDFVPRLVSDDHYAGEIRRYGNDLYGFCSSYNDGTWSTCNYPADWVRWDEARRLHHIPVTAETPVEGMFLGYDAEIGLWRPLVPEVPPLPYRGVMWHHQSTVMEGNDLGIFIDTAQAFGHVTRIHTAANGDRFTNACLLGAGYYNFYVLGSTNINSGRIQWTINGEPMGGVQEWYSASTTRNVVQVINEVLVPQSGHVTISATVEGKHASSSDYYIYLTNMWFKSPTDLDWWSESEW